MAASALVVSSAKVGLVGADAPTAEQIEKLLAGHGYSVRRVVVNNGVALPELVLIDARIHPEAAAATLLGLQADPVTAAIATVLLLPEHPAPELLELAVTRASDFLLAPLRDEELAARVTLRLRLHRPHDAHCRG